MRTLWIFIACLVCYSGCKKPTVPKAPRSLQAVNSKLEGLKKNRTVAPDTGPLSTMVHSSREEPTLYIPDAQAGFSDSANTSDPASSETAPKKKRRVSLPAPLKPHRPEAAPESDAPEPCTIVVSRICSILTEGAEECAEARQMLPQLNNVDAQARCADALAWYERRFSDERRTKPCALLADVICRKAGPKTLQCQRAKEDVRLLKKTIQHACKAAILMTLALR